MITWVKTLYGRLVGARPSSCKTEIVERYMFRKGLFRYIKIQLEREVRSEDKHKGKWMIWNYFSHSSQRASIVLSSLSSWIFDISKMACCNGSDWNVNLVMTFFDGSSGVQLWEEWRSGESTRLPPMWPGFDSRSGVIRGLSLFVLYSAPKGFLRVLRFPPSSKTNIWLDLRSLLISV